jgi:ribokinase
MFVSGFGQTSLDYISVVEKYPEEDIKYEVSGWNRQGGGPVPTALVTLSRLGVNAKFMGFIGDDEAGQFIRNALAAEKVNIEHLIKIKNALSQIAFVIVNKKNGKRTIFYSKISKKPEKFSC